MNKIGRKQIARKAALVLVAREFMAAEPDAQRYAERSLGESLSGHVVADRWLSWKPVGPVDVTTGQSQRDWVTNRVSVMGKQTWEWRFIGRRRRK